MLQEKGTEMSRNRTIRSTATRLSAATALLLALGACGSESEDSGSSPDGVDAGAATLSDQPFCDQLDTAAVAELLGMAPDKVKVQVDREVGEEFEGPNEEGSPPTSVANMCALGSGTSQLVVSVQPDATEDDVQRTLDDLSALTGKQSSETCEPAGASAFGDPAGAFMCTSDPPVKRVRVVVTGLVGESKFYCAAMVNQGARDDLAEAATEVCRTTMVQLTA